MARCNIWTIGAGCMVVVLATGDSECYCQDSAAVLGRPQASYTPGNELDRGSDLLFERANVGGSEPRGPSGIPARRLHRRKAGLQPGAWGVANGRIYPLGDKVAPMASNLHPSSPSTSIPTSGSGRPSVST